MTYIETAQQKMPSLHLFASNCSKQEAFSDLELIKDLHQGMLNEKKSASISQIADNLDTLKQQIETLNGKSSSNIILFNTPQKSARSPEFLLEFAWEMAKQERKTVLIIDCDFRTNSLNESYRIKTGTGLSDLVTGNVVTFDQIIKKTNIENVYLIKCGTHIAEPTKILLSNNFINHLSRLKTAFDYLLLNSPPYLDYIDTFILCKYLRPVVVQVCTNKDNLTKIEGIQNELDVLNLDIFTLYSEK